MVTEWDPINPLVESKNRVVLLQVYKAPSQGHSIALLLYQQKKS